MNESEVTTPQTALLKQGASIIRLENTEQLSVAVQRPRDPEKIMNAALKSLDIYPAFAEKAHYLKPVGKDRDGNQKYAEGLSIRAAESLRCLWDNSAISCEVIAEDDTSVTLSCVFLDYEKNKRDVYNKKVSKYYKTYEGKIVMHPPDRFADVVLPANQSKLLRETILRSLPAELKMAYSEHAKEIMRRKPQANRIKSMVDAFTVFGVKKEQIEQLKGKPLTQWTPEEIDEMQGIYNALRDEETTVEQVFGVRQEPVEPNKLKVKAKPEEKVDPEFEKKRKKALEKLAAPVLDYCPYCKATIDDLEHMTVVNKSGNRECADCGYELIQRPK